MQNDTRTGFIIMGSAGRDFHNFNVVFRNDPLTRVVVEYELQERGCELETILADFDYYKLAGG